MSTHNYDLTTDFSNGVNTVKLANEIPTVTSKIFTISVAGNNVTIIFSTSLSAGEITSLNSIIASHDATTPPTSGMSGSDETETVVTSSTYQQKLRLTTNYLYQGVYMIMWSFSYNTEDIIDVRIQIDDTTTIHELYYKPDNYDDSYKFHDSGFYPVTLTTGVHNIDIDFRGSNGNANSLFNVRLFVMPRDV